MGTLTKYRLAFFFLLLIPTFILTFEVRKTLIDLSESQRNLFLIHQQLASHTKTILGIQARILHYAEGHDEEYSFVGCPPCFNNLIKEEYSHELIQKFLREHGIDPEEKDTETNQPHDGSNP